MKICKKKKLRKLIKQLKEQKVVFIPFNDENESCAKWLYDKKMCEYSGNGDRFKLIWIGEDRNYLADIYDSRFLRIIIKVAAFVYKIF